MTVGTLGKKIIFEVSDEKALVLQSMSREVSGRWTDHETQGAKPKPEFLGPDNQTVSLTIYLSAALGVKPRAMLDAIADMVEAGGAEYLIIGSKPVGANPFRLTASSETWDHMYAGGELSRATVSITLEEYT